MTRTHCLGLLLLAVALETLAQPANADNWPRFRGPNGAGIAADKEVPIHWTQKDGVLWRTAIPGQGNSSPVVWGDRLFLQSATVKERMLLCLNVHDGKILWTQTVPGTKAHTHPKNTLASSTPATDGKRVYAVFWDGKDIALYAYDFEGKQLWKRDLGGFESQHGVGMSPMIHEDRVILANDQDVSSVLLAFDAADGKTAWEAPRKHFRACYSTPFLLEKPGQTPELIVGSTSGLTSYDPRSGKEIWDWTWKFDSMALRTVSSPIYSQGTILATSGDGKGPRHMVAVTAGNPAARRKPSLAWQNKRDFPYVPSLLAWGNHIYSVTEEGIAACHVLKTGKEVWRHRLDCTVTSSPILIDGKIYVASDQGDVSVFTASPTFNLLATNPIGERATATPAVADNRLFIRGDKHLFCIGKQRDK
jgi:outer membrane protein assembly factor BamB